MRRYYEFNNVKYEANRKHDKFNNVDWKAIRSLMYPMMLKEKLSEGIINSMTLIRKLWEGDIYQMIWNEKLSEDMINSMNLNSNDVGKEVMKDMIIPIMFNEKLLQNK